MTNSSIQKAVLSNLILIYLILNLISAQVNDDSAYAVFISYTEVYNKYIFDLLADEQVDEFGQPVLPESKSVREDTK